MELNTISELEPQAPSAEEMEAIEAEIAELAEKAMLVREETERELAQEIEAKFLDRSRKRVNKEAEWVASLALYQGVLNYGQNQYTDAERPFEKRDTKRKPEVNIVARKVDVIVAQNWSSQFAGGNKNWDINALSVQSSEGVTPQEAAIRAEGLEEEIYKQLNHCKYAAHARMAMEDRAILGTGIMKGPTNRLQMKKTYRIDPASGTAIPVVTSHKMPSAIRVDPWLFYPDDTVQTIEECDEGVIEAHPTGKNDFVKLRNREDFRSDVIDEILREDPLNNETRNESMYANFSNNMELWKNKYTHLEYHGPISKDRLGKLGICPAYDTPVDYYYGEVWVCQGKITRIELSNIEGAYSVPYAVDVWQKDPGSIFGIGAPLLMQDNQKVVNVAWQMVLDNGSLSSGPQVIIDKTVLAPQNNTWDVEPWKIWLTTQYGQNVQNAIQYIDVPNRGEQLLAILHEAMSFAEMESGVNLMSQGLQSPTMGDPNATTTAIYNTNSTTINDYKNEQWDDNITQKVIDWMVDWNMQYNPNPNIKADFEVDVKSSTDLRSSELQAKNLEKVSVESAQDPVMGMVINRQNLTKARLSLMNLPSRGIVRSDAEIQAEQEKQAQNPQPDPETMKHEAAMRKLDLEEKELQFKATKEMEQAKMDFEERMRNADVREYEAQAQVLAADLNLRSQMAQLASRDEQGRQKILADLEKAQLQDQTKRFLAGMEHTVKTRNQALKEAEAKQAMKTGEGW